MRKTLQVFLTLVMSVTLFSRNPLAIAAKGTDWIVDETYGGSISESIIDGKRYMELSSTPANDNGGKPAVFRTDESWGIKEKEGSMSFNFIPATSGDTTRFSVFLFFTDTNNFLSVGYDKGGWFWEYKSDQVGGDWYKAQRVAAPQAGIPVELEIELKDNRLMASTEIEGEKVEVINQIFDVNILDSLIESSTDTALKLGTWGSELSKVLVLDSDQEDIPIIHDKERPVLDRYDQFEASYDFVEAAYEEGMFDVHGGKVAFEQTEAGLIIDFQDKGKNLITFNELPLLENFEMEIKAKALGKANRFGFTYRLKDGKNFSTISTGDQSNQYFAEHFGDLGNAWSANYSGPEFNDDAFHTLKMRVHNSNIVLFVDGIEVLNTDMKGFAEGAQEYGLFKDRGAAKVLIESIDIKKIVPERPANPQEDLAVVELTNDFMTVAMHEAFPTVYEYKLTDGKVMTGQLNRLETMKINNKIVKPEVSIAQHTDELIDYALTIEDEEQGIFASMTVRFVLDNDTLTMRIIDIEKLTDASDFIISEIEFPNQSLVSVNSGQDNAHIMGTTLSVNTIKSGDDHRAITETMRNYNEKYMYAVIYNDDLAASMHSSSQYGRNFERLSASATEYTDFVSVGLASSPFIYRKSAEYDEHTIDEPIVKVIITGERNGDGKIDWQDGAIAFRDIMHVPLGAENVKDLVAYRIAMTFGSHAQNPFLKTLDNIKKVNLHTYGLGQSILIKGYGSEGHDSGHLDYANIGQRIGGTEDFVYLLKAAKDYGAEIGIHVNASETYPESKYFTEELLRKAADGSYNYGWNWLDQGINIDAAYDLANGRRARWEELKEKVGDDLDWVYVDVWGNGQSGDNGAWASHQLAKEIQDQGWRLGGEWGYAFEPDSTFQHWATDLPYGGYTLKGINSAMTRFIFNHQRDAWVAHEPKYKGAAETPLLGGYNMTDFEGWQGRNDYNKYMTNLFENNVPTKFVQHFEVMQWIEGESVRMNHPGGQGTIDWTPEMKVVLEDKDQNEVVIMRKSNDYENEYERYSSREMFYNDRKVLDGDRYLLPWYWDEKGAALDYEKLYHFNKTGGKSTWEVPSHWSGEVFVYELTELGLKEHDKLSINDGQITLDAQASHAYVISNQALESPEVNWGEGTPLVDPGFNAHNLDAWTVEGEGAEVVKTEASNAVLKISDNDKTTKVSQVLRDLKPGENYVAYVNVDNRSDSKAFMEIGLPNGEVKKNYTNRSIAKNYVKAEAHNTNSPTVDGISKFQNMFIHFTAPAEGEVTLTLGKNSGTEAAYFDDVRVTVNEGDVWVDKDTFFQDFENNAQGIYPFVVGNVENVEDNRTHLSELHDPYTQRGWNNKVISDVIDGNWSLKTNGLVRKNRLVYQTIPQNIRFQPGVKYTISFDYEQGSDDTYALMIGDGPYTGQEKQIPLKTTRDKDGPQKYEFEITGSKTGQTWFGIYSTNVAADTEDSADKEANFRGYSDFIMDNVLITKEETAVTLTKDDVVIKGSSKYLPEASELDFEINEERYTDTYRFFVEQGEDRSALIVNAKEPVSFTLATRKGEVVDSIQVQDNEGNWYRPSFFGHNGLVDLELKDMQAIRINYEKPALDGSELESLIEGIDTLEKDLYTEASWTQLMKEKEAILLEYEKVNKQEEIDALVEKLHDAIDKLVLKEHKPGTEPGDKPNEKPDDKPGDKPDDKPGEKPADKPGDKPNDNSQTETIPATGSSQGLKILVISSSLVVAGAFFLLVSLKKKYE